MPSAAAVPGLRIRPPSPIERRAWRMLLPEVAMSLDPCHILVAVAPFDPGDPTPRVIGAIAATEHHALVPRRGPRVLPHVIAPLRRRGVGRALVDAMADAVMAMAARQGRDPDVLYAWSAAEPGTPESDAWRGMGFTLGVESVVHEIDAARSLAFLEPLYQRIAGRVPAEARVIPLGSTTSQQRDAVTDLHVQHLGGQRLEVRASLEVPGHPYRPESPVLVRGERVVGFSLSRSVPGLLIIDANVLDADHRKGWANVVLKYEEARFALAAGLLKGEFQTFDRHRDTRRFAEHVGGVATRTVTTPCRPLRA